MEKEITLGDLFFVSWAMADRMSEYELGSEEYECAKKIRQHIGELQQRLYAEKKITITATL